MPRRERFRQRRSPAATWSARLLGVAGTAIVLAAGLAALQVVLGSDDEGAADPSRAATAPAGAVGQGAGGLGLSREQRAQRRRAVRELHEQGYAPVSLRHYEPDHLLQVLIGRPTGGTPPGLRAFFFVDDEYIGMDATSPSGSLRPGRQREREITLVYGRYERGDRVCCPTGREERVRFRWNGEALVPRNEIPPGRARMP